MFGEAQTISKSVLVATKGDGIPGLARAGLWLCKRGLCAIDIGSECPYATF